MGRLQENPYRYVRSNFCLKAIHLGPNFAAALGTLLRGHGLTLHVNADMAEDQKTVKSMLYLSHVLPQGLLDGVTYLRIVLPDVRKHMTDEAQAHEDRLNRIADGSEPITQAEIDKDNEELQEILHDNENCDLETAQQDSFLPLAMFPNLRTIYIAGETLPTTLSGSGTTAGPSLRSVCLAWSRYGVRPWRLVSLMSSPCPTCKDQFRPGRHRFRRLQIYLSSKVNFRNDIWGHRGDLLRNLGYPLQATKLEKDPDETDEDSDEMDEIDAADRRLNRRQYRPPAHRPHDKPPILFKIAPRDVCSRGNKIACSDLQMTCCWGYRVSMYEAGAPAYNLTLRDRRWQHAVSNFFWMDILRRFYVVVQFEFDGTAMAWEEEMWDDPAETSLLVLLELHNQRASLNIVSVGLHGDEFSVEWDGEPLPHNEPDPNHTYAKWLTGSDRIYNMKDDFSLWLTHNADNYERGEYMHPATQSDDPPWEFVTPPGTDDEESVDGDGARDGGEGMESAPSRSGETTTNNAVNGGGGGEANGGGGGEANGGDSDANGGGEVKGGGGEANSGGGEANSGGGEANSGGGEANGGGDEDEEMEDGETSEEESEEETTVTDNAVTGQNRKRRRDEDDDGDQETHNYNLRPRKVIRYTH
jgi:hypothetical protein